MSVQQNNAYKLVYEVRDNTTDIIQEQVFDVTVMSPFGSGLIVCDTKDEMTSDVSLIMAYNFTDSYHKEQDTVMRNLFSSVNGRKTMELRQPSVLPLIRSTVR